MNQILGYFLALPIVIAIAALSSLMGGWLLMLLVGVIHHEWIAALPTIGYWWAVIVIFLGRMVFGRVTATASKA